MSIEDFYSNRANNCGFATWQYPIFDLVREGSTILDVGAGSGHFATELKTRKGCKVSCIDYSIPNVHSMREKGLDSHRVNIETESLPFLDESFDQVLFVEVIEHLFSPNNVIKEIFRVLKPNGELILSTPNAVNIERRVKYLFLGEIPPMNDVTLTEGEHIRLYNRAIIERLLQQAKFTSICNHSWMLTPKVKKFISPVLLKDWLTQHVLVVAKKP